MDTPTDLYAERDSPSPPAKLSLFFPFSIHLFLAPLFRRFLRSSSSSYYSQIRRFPLTRPPMELTIHDQIYTPPCWLDPPPTASLFFRPVDVFFPLAIQLSPCFIARNFLLFRVFSLLFSDFSRCPENDPRKKKRRRKRRKMKKYRRPADVTATRSW